MAGTELTSKLPTPPSFCSYFHETSSVALKDLCRRRLLGILVDLEPITALCPTSRKYH